MKFNTTALPQDLRARGEVQIGDVFPAKGRKPTVCWVVIGLHNSSAMLVGLSEQGDVVSSQSYYARHLTERPIIGRCPQVAEMRFDIEWISTPRCCEGI